jgi:hypothetical protein
MAEHAPIVNSGNPGMSFIALTPNENTTTGTAKCANFAVTLELESTKSENMWLLEAKNLPDICKQKFTLPRPALQRSGFLSICNGATFFRFRRTARCSV